jgi:hypothetical protein
MLEEYRRFEPMFERYQWPWETARWHELVFCLLVRIDDSPPGIAVARETTEILVNLDLLEVGVLAKAVTGKGEPDFPEPELALMTGILRRQGYDNTEAEIAVVTICEAAYALQQGFDGKVQKYLRKYGELMISELPENFSLSRMSEEDTNHAFANWLQNVLNMPVAFSNPSVKALCEKLSIKPEELSDIADTNDINLALVDDWAADYLKREKSEGSHE